MFQPQIEMLFLQVANSLVETLSMSSAQVFTGTYLHDCSNYLENWQQLREVVKHDTRIIEQISVFVAKYGSDKL